MAPLDKFSSPANQALKDLSDCPAELAAFEANWDANLIRWTEQSILGNPWSNLNDDNRYYYFNPRTTDISGLKIPAPITWNPFPGRFANFFQSPQTPPDRVLTNDQLYELVGTGAYTDANGKQVSIDQIEVPSVLCLTNDWSSLTTYTPAGSRGWLDEYCEWSVRYDADGSLRQVMFTCENPAYWFTMWRVNPDIVVSLYQQYVNPAVQREDLYLLDANGQPVMDPLTGDYAYDPTNKWNRDTQTMPDHGGAIHLTSAPNTLSAEIYLAAAATIARKCGNSSSQTLICCSQYGRPRRNSDPHIGQQTNQDVVNNNLIATLLDPIGLYIQMPNFSLWSAPSQPSLDVSSFWQITRGEQPDPNNQGQGYDSILHAVFTVPEGMKSTDILIQDPDGNQNPLRWASQIAQTFQIALRVGALPPPASMPAGPVPQAPRGCVVSLASSNPQLQPWPVQLLPADMANAGSPIDLAPYIKQGATAPMMLNVQGGAANVTIEFAPPDGITVSDIVYLPSGPGTPGQTSGGGTQAYTFTLAVAADAPLGDRSIRVTNTDYVVPANGVAWLPGMLSVVAAS